VVGAAAAAVTYVVAFASLTRQRRGRPNNRQAADRRHVA